MLYRLSNRFSSIVPSTLDNRPMLNLTPVHAITSVGITVYLRSLEELAEAQKYYEGCEQSLAETPLDKREEFPYALFVRPLEGELGILWLLAQAKLAEDKGDG